MTFTQTCGRRGGRRATRTTFDDPDAHMVFPEIISK